MGSPLGAAKYNSLLQGAASLDRLGTTGLRFRLQTSVGMKEKRLAVCFASKTRNYFVRFQVS